jgi:4-hydroxybenzoate polyprenyltransferase
MSLNKEDSSFRGSTEINNTCSTYKKQCSGWLSLLRIPNLFTLPGDVILGFMIAESSLENSDFILGFSYCRGVFLSLNIFYILIAIFSVYCFGLITNDLADFYEDAESRPERPLPAGIISKKSARIAALLFALSGLLFAGFANQKTFIAVLGLLFLVIGYNYFLKKNILLGPFALGLCRTLSVVVGFLGAGLNFEVYPPMFYIVSLIWFLYFFAISLVAYHETEDQSHTRGAYVFLLIPLVWGITVPFASDALGVVLIVGELPPGLFLAVGAFLVFSLFIVKNFISLKLQSPSPLIVQKSVGELIRSIIFLQASGCAFLGYPYIALALFLLWFPPRILAGRFYSS